MTKPPATKLLSVDADRKLTIGDAAKNLDYLEVVHVFIRRSNQGCPALSEASQNSVESNKIGFKVGTRINPDVLNAEQQLYTVMRDLNKARVDAVMQSLKLKATTGSLDADDLAALEKLMQPIQPATLNPENQVSR